LAGAQEAERLLAGQMTEPSGYGVQAYFIHDRLLAATVSEDAQRALADEVERRSRVSFTRDAAIVAAYETLISRLLDETTELSLAAADGPALVGTRVALTQNLYFRGESDDIGAFQGTLDVDRSVRLSGTFSRDRLLFSTGRTEIWGQKRLSLLALVDGFTDSGSAPKLSLRPLFIGRRLVAPSTPEQTRRLAPWALEQFAQSQGQDAIQRDARIVARMTSSDIREAFARLLGLTPGPIDGTFTARIAVGEIPLDALVSFTTDDHANSRLQLGPYGRGSVEVMHLVQASADVIILQHRGPVGGSVVNLLEAACRRTKSRYLVLDDLNSALVLRAYGLMPAAS
jgi:hypothetical protein